MSARVAWVVLALSACHDPTRPNFEFVPDMVDPVPFEAYSGNPVFRNGRTLQAPVDGTIARGATPFHFQAGPDEAARAGREVVNPVADSPQVRSRGEKVFRSKCSVCHGATGQGDGPIVPRFPAPPSLTAAHARALADGQVFHIITYGQGLMPGHAAQVLPNDRWCIVWFLRALQGGTP